MIPEHEILEQLLADDQPLAWVVELLERLGRDPWLVVLRHWQDGDVVLLRRELGVEVPGWEVRRVVRKRAAPADVSVRVTDRGARIAC